MYTKSLSKHQSGTWVKGWVREEMDSPDVNLSYGAYRPKENVTEFLLQDEIQPCLCGHLVASTLE